MPPPYATTLDATRAEWAEVEPRAAPPHPIRAPYGYMLKQARWVPNPRCPCDSASSPWSTSGAPRSPAAGSPRSCRWAIRTRLEGRPPALARGEAWTSVALRQSQNTLGDIAQHELLADRRNAGDHDLAQEALDVELLGVAVAAVGHHRALAGVPGGTSAHVLGGVGLGTAFLAVVVQPRRLEGQQVGRFERHPALGQGVLDRLVLADRPAENDALLGVLRGPGQCCLADADCLRGDQHALGIQPVQQVVETLALFADAILERHLQAIDEHLVGVDRLATHLLDLADLDLRAVEVRVEQRQAVGRLPALLLWSGAGDQEHLVGDLRRRRPHLLAVYHVAVAVAFGAGVEGGRVEAGIGLGDGEAALYLALDDVGQDAPLLFLGAEHHDRVRAEDIEVNRRGALQRRARLGHRLHQQGRLGDAETRAAVFLGHGDAQPAGIGHRLVEVVGKSAFLVLLQPVPVVELGTQPGDAVADRELVLGEGEIHGGVLPVGGEPGEHDLVERLRAFDVGKVARPGDALVATARDPGRDQPVALRRRALVLVAADHQGRHLDGRQPVEIVEVLDGRHAAGRALRRRAADRVADLAPAHRVHLPELVGEPALHRAVGQRGQALAADRRLALFPGAGRAGRRRGLGVAQGQRQQPVGVGQREALADHAADRQADVVDPGDAEHVERGLHVGRQPVHRVVAGDRRAAAVAAHVEPQHAVARGQQRHHLLDPHAAIGVQRVREAHRRRVLRAGEVEVDATSVE